MSSGIEFETDKINSGFRRPSAPGSSSGGFGQSSNERGMTGWLVRKGIVKSSNAGQGVLVGIVIANIVIIYIVINYFL